VKKDLKGYGSNLRKYYSGVCLETVKEELQKPPIRITTFLAEI
jgi:hypothetical protein